MKRQFPILHKEINKSPLVYLDNAATTQKPEVVIDAIGEYYRNFNANIHGGLHKLSHESNTLWEKVHEVVAHFIGAKNAKEVVIVRNSTEGINLIAQTYGIRNLKEGEVVAITEAEHHSNMLPWIDIAERVKAKVEWLPVDDEGKVDLEYLMYLQRKYRGRLKIVAVNHISNVLGYENEIKELSELVHANGTVLVVDGAQSIAHLPVNVKKLGCDFYVFSGHKIYAPNGAGAVWGRLDLMKDLEPFMRGGGTIKDVTKNKVIWADMPNRFEAGTPDVASAVGLGIALLWLQDRLSNWSAGDDWYPKSGSEYLSTLLSYARPLNSKKSIDEGWDGLMKQEEILMKDSLDFLCADERVSVVGSLDSQKRKGVVSFTVDGVHPHDLASLFDEKGIAIRAGMHCAHPLHQRFGISATARISFALYNTVEDVQRFKSAFNEILLKFK